MLAVIILTAFYFILLLLGCAMYKGHGGNFSTLRGFAESRGMAPEDIARLTGKIIIGTALFFQAVALLFSYTTGGLNLVFKNCTAAIILAILAYLLSCRMPSKFNP